MYFEWSTLPKSGGWQHIVGIILMVAALIGGAFLGVKCSGDENEKRNSKILGFAGIFFIVMDIFIEVFMSIKTGYLLTYIPFQLCSMVMYVLPFIPFIKKGVVKDGFLGLVAFVSTTGAFFYFVKPTAAFNPYVIKTIHSIMWHVCMVGLGTFTMTAFDLLDFKRYRGFIAALISYVGMVLIAIVGNFILHAIDPLQETNLFYISYYNMTYSNPFTYPILSLIMKSQKPYVVYVIAFIIYFALGASACYGIGQGLKWVIAKIKAKKSA